jgi:hypothetical protein
VELAAGGGVSGLMMRFSVRQGWEHAFVSIKNAERDRRIAEAWVAGVPLPEIAAEFLLSKGRVSIIAKALGLAQRQPRPTDEDRARFAELYTIGLSVAEVAHRTGWHRDTVTRGLHNRGIEIRSAADRARRWPVRHDAFSPPVSPEGWYWIGFLAADGHISGSSVTLTQKITRAEVLRRFLGFLGCGHRPLGSRNHPSGRTASVSSPQLVADLAIHGVVPRKSYQLKTSETAAPQPLFWLGVFDGDGSIVISRRGVPTIQVAGASDLMGQLARFLGVRLTGTEPAVVRHGQSDVLWTVRVAGDRARQLAELWLAESEVSLHDKRAKLRIAAGYESRATGARLAVRRARCDYCGAWVERFPSQLGDHVFCSRSHFGKWNMARRNGERASTPIGAHLQF